MEENKLEKKIPQRPVPTKPMPTKPTPIKPAPPKKEETENITIKEPPNKSDKKERVKTVKNKEPKQKNKLSKKVLIIIICSVLFVLCVVAGIVAYILIDKANNKKLDAPIIKVEQLFNGTILEATKIDGATSYEFEITNLLNSKKTTIKVTSNVVELSSYLNQAGNYSVKVRVLGKGKGATSEYSEKVDFVNYVQLEAPKVFVNNLNKQNDLLYITNNDMSDDTLSWDIIPNAKEYIVRYGVNEESGVISSFKVDQTTGVLFCPMANIYKFGTGSYQISVIAVPEDGSYYLQSDYNQIINIEYYAAQDEVAYAKFDKQTNILEFRLVLGSNYGNEFNLLVNGLNGHNEYKIYLDKCLQENKDGLLIATISLEQIISDDVTSMKIISVGDGKFSTDSESLNIIINN